MGPLQNACDEASRYTNQIGDMLGKGEEAAARRQSVRRMAIRKRSMQPTCGRANCPSQALYAGRLWS
ncbi:hypothetical protein FBQ95_16565 [Chloroflexi bacterium CFX3]|nr:hypothetical protein [Chloroflexi bacterium CFX3]